MCSIKSPEDTKCGMRCLTLAQKSSLPVQYVLKNNMRIEVFQKRAPPGLEV